MSRIGREPKHPPRRGTPSWTFTNLVELGTSARHGYLLTRGPHPSPSVAATLQRVAEERAELYDAELGKALECVELVREQRGDLAARVLEARFVDGMPWKQVSYELGITVTAASSIAEKALRWLDVEAGGGVSQS